jgi:hypothetical protein
MKADRLNILITNPGLLNAETVDELKEVVEKYPFFEVAWLLYLKNLKQIKSAEYNLVLKKVAVRVSDRKMLYKFLNTDFRKKHVKTKSDNPVSAMYKLEDENELLTGESLIDKFLLAKPRVIRQPSEEQQHNTATNLKEMAEKSTVENDEIITETLAILYFEQKNFEKAMDAYNKLSLKYPEKSVYFATRIEEIEKLKNI